MGVIYRCSSEQRREAVINSAYNGIDCIEVKVPSQPSRLILTFLNNSPMPALTPDNVMISGNAQSEPVQINTVIPNGPKAFEIELQAPGDLSTYTLCLPKGDNLDPRLAKIDFTFRNELPVDLTASAFTAYPPSEAEINYLAKDYISFSRLMLDRMAMLLPGGMEDQPADLQVALVEMLAYAADHLSYYQDAVATEAYLGTARGRASLGRHARLLNYKVHEGCNARVWMCCKVSVSDPVPVGADWQFLTDDAQPVIFEPCHYPKIYPQHNSIDFHTWGDVDYQLPRGTTYATLLQKNPLLLLKPGDLLLLEVAAQDADTSLRHVVRLTQVEESHDPIEGLDVVEVAWDTEDALPFDLPVKSTGTLIAYAHGNIVMADHGFWQGLNNPIPLDPVPKRANYRPYLPMGPLTRVESLPRDLINLVSEVTFTSAVGLMLRDVRAALPVIKLEGDGDVWLPCHDLLENHSMAAVFVVETGNDSSLYLRFGDNTYGRRPTDGATFTASYRLGTGRVGNVGAEMICKVEGTGVEGIEVSNPLPARGGEDPEPAEQVRLFAPQAFRSQKRAITAADYAALAQNFSDVQRAAADIRWTGSWYTVYLFVDRLGGRTIDDDFKQRLLSYMDGYRLAGYDLEIRRPTYVPLKIELTIEIKTGFVPNAVMAALQGAFSTRDLSGGSRGYFHPDNWTFGQPVYLSHFYSAALAVPGVAVIDVDVFQRLDDKAGGMARDAGVVVMGPHEIVAHTLEPKPTLTGDGSLQFTIGDMK